MASLHDHWVDYWGHYKILGRILSMIVFVRDVLIHQIPALMAAFLWSLSCMDVLIGCGLLTLVAITIFRREISCNHCYSADEKRASGSSEASSRGSHSTGQSEAAASWEAYMVLEAAGNCYSLAYYTAAFVLNILQMILPKAAVKSLWKSFSSWWTLASEFQRLDEMLDGAEIWSVYSPPIIDVIVPETKGQQEIYTSLFPAVDELPLDATVQIFSFLHPKDVLTVASVSKQANEIVTNRNNDLSKALWKKLWFRDYAWITTTWKVGRIAMERSLETMSRNDPMAEDACLSDISFHRDFYFDFGLAFMDYILAGHCTENSCLVGIGGHVYDMTGFLSQHPGSRETVLVNAGRDVSEEFEGIRHTLNARTRAQKLCVVVDAARDGGCGLRPTDRCSLSKESPLPLAHEGIVPDGRPKAHVFTTLESAARRFRQGVIDSQRYAKRIAGKHNALDSIHTYYDPFLESWRAWYINADFEAAFIDDFEVPMRR